MHVPPLNSDLVRTRVGAALRGAARPARLALLAALAVCPAPPARAAAPAISAQQAATHAMRYHLALPTGWVPGRSWPVLVVIPDAGREFTANLRAFVAVRGAGPLILVAPEVLSCGGARTRTPDHYSYTSAEWDSLSAGDDFAFDDAGLAAVLADVHRRWGGEAKAFLTGWEAGGHTVWAQALSRPERWRGVAPVSTNYQARGLDAARFSTAPGRATLAIQPFRASGDAPGMPFFEQQTARALADARAHGFAPRPVRLVPDREHGPLAAAVLAWCDSLVRAGAARGG